MISYVTDTSGWERWQRDYRLGLILIMPPGPVADLVNPLRARYDPVTYAICPAHITLSDPLRREMTPDREREICDILAGIAPFTLHFDKPHAYLYALTAPQHRPWLVPSRVLSHDVPCRWCYADVCPVGHHLCLRGVQPAEVVDAVRELLREPRV